MASRQTASQGNQEITLVKFQSFFKTYLQQNFLNKHTFQSLIGEYRLSYEFQPEKYIVP